MPKPTVIVGFDYEGDPSIYITDGGGNHLSEIQMCVVAHKLQSLLDSGELLVDFSEASIGDDFENEI